MEATERVKILVTDGKTTAHDALTEKNKEKLGDENGNTNEGTSTENEEPVFVIDENLVEEGKRFFYANFFSLFVSMLTGLWTLMYIDTIVRVLSLTKRSHTPTLAFKRYLGTLRHVMRWHEGVEDMKESLKVVRGQHKAAASKAATPDKHGITQFDMVVTQWAFIGPTLLFPEQLGVSIDYSERELEGLVYVMYLVGRDLGVEDEYNLCRGGLGEARAYSREILVGVIQPAVKENFGSKESINMANALLAGINILNPFTEPEALAKFSLKLFKMEDLIKDDSKVSSYSRFIYTMMDIVFNKLLHISNMGDILRTMLNQMMRLNIFIAWNWEGFLMTYYQYKGVNVSVVDRVLAILAIPVMSGVTGAAMLWRYIDKINLLLVIAFYAVVFAMVK